MVADASGCCASEVSAEATAFPSPSAGAMQPTLDRIVLIGEASLQRATTQFVLHYHQERNHQGLDNKIIRPEFNPLPATGTIRRRKRLGGMLNYYYREAA